MRLQLCQEYMMISFCALMAPLPPILLRRFAVTKSSLIAWPSVPPCLCPVDKSLCIATFHSGLRWYGIFVAGMLVRRADALPYSRDIGQSTNHLRPLWGG